MAQAILKSSNFIQEEINFIKSRKPYAKPDKADLSEQHASRSISPMSTLVVSIYHLVCHKIPWNKFQHLPRSIRSFIYSIQMN